MGELAADPLRDRRLREAATTIVQVIIERVEDRAEMPGIMGAIARAGSAATNFDLTTSSPHLHDIGLPSKIEFDVFLVQHIPGAMLACFDVKAFELEPHGREAESYIRLSVLPRGAAALATNYPRKFHEGLVHTLKNNAEIIAHEVIHMLDRFRGNTAIGGNCKPPYMEISPRDPRYIGVYVNNAVEFNALFQQGIFELQQFLENHATDLQKRWVMLAFENFEVVAEKASGISVLRKNTVGKWRKKLDQRLWQTWSHWKESGL